MSESYSFFSKQFRVIIKITGNLYVFAVINYDTNEFFQSQETELKRISLRTLTAAFNDKVKNITNQIIYEDSSHIKITIRVSLDYLPQFCQDIHLNKVQQGQKQFQRFQYLELQNQIKKVQKQAQWLFDTYTNKKIKTFQKQVVNIDGYAYQQLWNFEVQKGNYLLQCNGFCVYQDESKRYSGDDKQDEYDQNAGGYYGNLNRFVSTSNFLFQVILNKSCVYSVSCKPFDYSYYQYPFQFSCVLHVQQDSQMSVQVIDSDNHKGILNRSQLNLQKIKILYD